MDGSGDNELDGPDSNKVPCLIHHSSVVVLKSTLTYFDPNRKGRNDSRCH